MSLLALWEDIYKEPTNVFSVIFVFFKSGEVSSICDSHSSFATSSSGKFFYFVFLIFPLQIWLTMLAFFFVFFFGYKKNCILWLLAFVWTLNPFFPLMENHWSNMWYAWFISYCREEWQFRETIFQCDSDNILFWWS